MTAPKPNAELAYLVLDHIDAHPEQWRQRTWAFKNDCGTAYCFAGWAVVLTGHDLSWDRLTENWSEADHVVNQSDPNDRIWLADVARNVLGVEFFASQGLFRSTNTREDLGRLVAEIFGPRPAGAE